MTALTFCKQERMVSRQLIETLFSGEHSASMARFPLRAVYMTIDRPEGAQTQPVQLLVSVSKKRFKHAVDRNRVKRQIREAYRHHKQLLGSALPDDKQLLLALVWLTNEHKATSDVDDNVRRLMERISEKL
ncbi:MAG: ribonuclease P protein component [Prevotella sp.]|nr:ribonuclease P protein component [Prevotella sp.]